MKEKRLHLLMKLTERSTFLAAITALVGGLLFLYEKGGQIVDYSRMASHPFATMTMGHKIILISLMLLIAIQIVRLIIVTFDFAAKRDWFYAVLGSFILMVIGYSLLY